MEIKCLLHDRIIEKCLDTFTSGFYEDAATSAMKQVDIALKEKTGEKKLFGVNMIKKYLSDGSSLKIISPINKERQNIIRNYFEASFSYYRNYAAHDGRLIDEIIASRILIIASELLEMLDVSSLSIINLGGIDKIIENGIFKSKQQLKNILEILLSQTIIDDTFDGLLETLFIENDFSEDNYNKVFEFGLIQYKTEANAIKEDVTNELLDYGYFELTDVGEEIVKELSNS